MINRWHHSRPMSDGVYEYKQRPNAKPRRLVLSLIRGRLASTVRPRHVGYWRAVK